jgi:hypothetical protein
MNPLVARNIAAPGLMPLSSEQRQQLARLGRRAYEHLFAGEFNPDAIPPDYDAWRHQQCLLCVERPGLRFCRNEDFLPMRAHFLRILGKHQEADYALQRAITDPRRQVQAAFERECRQVGDVLPNARQYAAGFCRNKRGVNLDDADEKTLWHALFMIRRRAQQLRRARD